MQAEKNDTPGSPIVEHIAFDDADALATAGEGWDQHYAQLATGKLQAEISVVGIPGLIITRERANRSLLIQAHTNGGELAFGNMGPTDDRARFLGKPFESNSLVTLQPFEQVMLRTPCRLDMVHVVVDTKLLSDTARCLSARDVVAELSGRYSLHADPRLKTSLACYLRRVLAGAIAVPSSLAAEAVQADIRAEVVGRFVAAAESCASEHKGRTPAPVRRRRIVSAIQTFVREHPDVPLTKLDLCRLANASERTLEYAFKDYYRMSPAAYLKTVRMNAVRKELLEAYRDENSVTAIAAKFGFWHLGHFARDYKQLFGESPSVSLSRSH